MQADGRTPLLAWSVWVAGIVAFGGSIALSAIDRHQSWSNVAQAFAFFSIGTVGLVVARNRPANPVGWLYLGVWAGVAFGFALCDEYGRWATIVHPGGFAGETAVWLGNWVWVPIFGVMLTFPFLFFPDGHLTSPRWRKVVWASVVVTVLWSISFAFEGADYTDPMNRPAPNPYAIHGLTPFFDAARILLAFVFIALVGLCVASLFVRFRRSQGEERQQIKWLMLSGAVFAVWLALPLQHGNGGWPDAVQGFVIALLPISVGIAILKYRLLDIDIVINKALVYGALGVFITLTYVGIVVGIGAVVGTRGNSVLSAVAAAVVALAFQPARRRAQHLANRLVYGKRATPYEVLSELSTRFAGTYSLDDALPRLARLVAESTGARKTVVWLRVGRELRPDAVWPSQEPESAITLEGDQLPALDDHSAEVRHQGELLGAVSVAMPPGEALTPASEKLLRDAAAQAGLVLRNVALVEDLRASRRRIVTAQDDRAKALERNIHDGAQQQLVALSVKHRLLAGMIGTDDERARAMVEQLLEDTNDALQNLRDLARGIYPPLLADKGLPDALAAQARKIATPIEISANGAGRYPQEVEAAVYFCVLEALQNVTKYANASKATVRIEAATGLLTFVVEDDGGGFDPQVTSHGTGLQGMTDRLEALGGSLRVDSHPGSGTTVIGRVPARTEAPGG